MSDSVAASWTVAITLALVGLAIYLVFRAYAEHLDRKRLDTARGITVWDADAEKWVHLEPGVKPGPGQMTSRDIEDADELELLWAAPAYTGTDLDAGLDRLRRAIRDEQQKGD